MHRLKIAAVEYMNTLPFLYGIEQCMDKKSISIISADPANCATLYSNNEVDIALVPVGALNNIGPYSIITDYCIGSNGPVDTVALLSQEPIDKITKIALDVHSRTSANLIKILCKKYWNISPEFCSTLLKSPNDSLLLIGDKVKEQESLYAYKYDLGHAWKNMVDLPMVFAVWVARDYIQKDVIDKLNNAFHHAVHHLDAVPLNGYANHIYWKHYLTHSIKYRLDENANKGMQHFLSLCNELKL